MLTETFQILGSNFAIKLFFLTYRHVSEHFAWALSGSAFYLSVLNIVEVVLFVPVAAETLRCRTDSPAVLSLRVSPADIKPVFPGFSDVLLELFEFFFAHNFTSIGVSNDSKRVIKE